MKTASFLIILFLGFNSSISHSQTSRQVFIGIYDGLTENMEFQFTDSKGTVYIFNEVGKDLDYDLYDEAIFGQKFKVTWEKRTVEILDDEDEPTGETEDINVILGLQKL